MWNTTLFLLIFYHHTYNIYVSAIQNKYSNILLSSHYNVTFVRNLVIAPLCPTYIVRYKTE